MCKWKNNLVFFCFMFFSATLVQGEYRIWEDTSGNIWEGEFVTMNAGRVVIQSRSGKKTEYSPEELSDNDLSHLEEIIPPKLSLDVSKSSDTSTSGRAESIICRASIKKANTRTYTGELTAVLVVIAEEMKTGAFSRAGAPAEFSFTLPKKHGVSLEFETPSIKLAKSSAKSGRVYAGYVLVVWDRFGNPIAVKSNRDSFLERAHRIARPK